MPPSSLSQSVSCWDFPKNSTINAAGPGEAAPSRPKLQAWHWPYSSASIWRGESLISGAPSSLPRDLCQPTLGSSYVPPQRPTQGSVTATHRRVSPSFRNSAQLPPDRDLRSSCATPTGRRPQRTTRPQIRRYASWGTGAPPGRMEGMEGKSNKPFQARHTNGPLGSTVGSRGSDTATRSNRRISPPVALPGPLAIADGLASADPWTSLGGGTNTSDTAVPTMGADASASQSTLTPAAIYFRAAHYCHGNRSDTDKLTDYLRNFLRTASEAEQQEFRSIIAGGIGCEVHSIVTDAFVTAQEQVNWERLIRAWRDTLAKPTDKS